MTDTRSIPPASVVVVTAGWFCAAIAATASGLLAELRAPAPQLVGAGLTAALIVAALIVPTLRAWLRDLDLRTVVSLHLTRFVGLYFLAAYRSGDLPYAFAVPAGVGDILVAVGAALLLGSGDPRRRPTAMLAWNTLGLLDILLVIGSAARQGMVDPGSMLALLRMPLGLLPTFLVPLIVASHVLVFWRLHVRPNLETREWAS